MATKKFVAPSMSAALQKVKQELGPEAVILSHDTFNGEVHITASSAESTLDILLAKSKQPLADIASVEPSEFKEPIQVMPDNATLALQNEMAVLKRMITEFKAPQQNDGMFSHGLQFFFHQKLQEMGFPNQFAKKLLVDLPADDTFEESIEHITTQLLCNLHCREVQPVAKYHTFIGPSGTGKTQLIVKIILHYLKNKSIENFACIFVNHQNVRVLEESKLYARIFNVPCFYVESQVELEFALHKTKHNDHVFIDFPAFDHKEPENNYYIPFIKEHQAEVHNTLVYAANIKNLKNYAALHEGIINEIAITKIDENPHIGEFIHYALVHNTPIGFMSVGQSYVSLEMASIDMLENMLANDLCPNRERLVMDKVFNV
ncbi:MAG: hypothetical protein AB7I18_08285 [Candidatus Berkiella sp.]